MPSPEVLLQAAEMMREEDAWHKYYRKRFGGTALERLKALEEEEWIRLHAKEGF